MQKIQHFLRKKVSKFQIKSYSYESVELNVIETEFPGGLNPLGGRLTHLEIK